MEHSWLYQFVSTHGVEILAGWWVFSVMSSNLPRPKDQNTFYAWFWGTCHSISGSLGAITAWFASRNPALAAVVQEVKQADGTTTTTAVVKENPQP